MNPPRYPARWLDTLANTLDEGLAFLDPLGGLTYANPALATLTGHPPTELCGHTLAELFENLTQPEGRGYCRHRDGRRIPVQITLHPVSGSNNETVGHIALVKDLSECLGIEESIQKLSAAVAQNPVGIMMTDRTGGIEYVNPAFCQQSGYTVEELVGQTPRLLQSGHTPQATYIYLWATLAQGREWRGELYDRKRDGSYYWAHSTIFGIRDSGGEVTHFIALQEDITERKQAENALRASAQQLRTLSERLLSIQEQERQRIASDLHDGIGQYLHALKFALQRAHPTLVGHSCVDLTQLIQEAIEEVRRIAADLRPAILDDLGILATIGWLCRRYQSLYPGLTVDKHLDIAETEVPEPLKITLFRVLQEALTNAAKHAQANRVVVELLRADNGIALSVRDNGVGFELVEVLGRDPAQRGFGLIGMPERVKLAGGSFMIDSQPGHGTTVRAAWSLG